MCILSVAFILKLENMLILEVWLQRKVDVVEFDGSNHTFTSPLFYM